MTAQEQDTPPVMADAVIAQVIQLKDPDEAISSAIWWRVAELLRTCTTATTSGPHLTNTLLEHAFTATDDVLSSLSADSEPGRGDVSHSPSTPDFVSLESAPPLDAALPLGAGYDALAATRRSCLRLARLLFSLDPTTPALLATRVNQLRRALTAWRFEALDAAVGHRVRPAS
ncbi:MAG TPA: hypothetical protein VK662_14315 [Acidothermaceae bacterium]|jgi:hypothetical protein|nr:hypothetical protein [Acidothermaceae bacterium]